MAKAHLEWLLLEKPDSRIRYIDKLIDETVAENDAIVVKEA